MKAKVKAADNNYKLLESDYYEAITCTAVYLGKHRKEFEGKEKISPLLYLGFELAEKIDGETKLIGKEYTFSMGERANLRKDFNTWFGSKERPFTDERADNADFNALVKEGIRARLNIAKVVSQKNKEYNKIEGITQTKKEIVRAASERSAKGITFDLDNPTLLEWESLPEWLQDKCKEAIDWNICAEKLGFISSKEESNPFAATPEEQKIINESASASDDEDDLPF